MLSAALLLLPEAVAGEGVWRKYLNGNNIVDVASDGDYIWTATDGGVVRWNRTDGEYARFFEEDGILSNQVTLVRLDHGGVPWISYEDSFIKDRLSFYAGGEWKTCDAANSGLSGYRVQSVFFDADGDLWVGSGWGGIYRYDGSVWTRYEPEELFDKAARTIVSDGNGVKWIGTNEGLWRLDGEDWTLYTTDDGLAGNSVTSLDIDRDNVLWIGTSSGVNRFDGRSFRTYSKDDGLVNNLVNVVRADTDGSIWVGTDHGVSRFDGQTWETFTQGDYLIDRIVDDIVIDSYNGVWFVHRDANKGVTLYDRAAWEWFVTYNNRLPTNTVTAVGAFDDGTVWFATDEGIYSGKAVELLYKDRIEWTLYTRDDGLESVDIDDIFIDADDNVWAIYNRSEKKGVSRFDGESWVTFNEQSGLKSNSVIAMTQDTDGAICFGTTMGISRYDGSSWTHYPGDDRLASPNIFDIAQTPDGIMWFGTDKGLSSYDGDSWMTYRAGSESLANDIIQVKAHTDGTIWCLSSNGRLMSFSDGRFTEHPLTTLDDGTERVLKIGCFTIDDSGRIWTDAGSESIAFDETGDVWKRDIMTFDGSEWNRRFVTTDVRFDSITAIDIDETGVVWIATDTGLRSFDGGPMVSYIINGPPNNYIRDIDVSDDNRKVFGTLRGISVFDESSWRNDLDFDRRAVAVDRDNVIWTTDIEGVKSRHIDGGEWTDHFETGEFNISAALSLAVDDKNVKWIGTGGGLVRFDDETWKLYIENEGFMTEWVSHLVVDRNGVKWFEVGRSKGLWNYDGETFMQFSKIDGLVDNRIQAITVDQNNRKWIGTPWGLSCYNDTTWTTYTVDNGLLSNHVTALAVDHANVLWVGSDRGVSRYDGVSWDYRTREDGLVYDEIVSIAVDYNNIKWFGTSRGISSYDDRTAGIDGGTPGALVIHGNFPNPFNPFTTIEFEVFTWGSATVSIYNTAGQNVRDIRVHPVHAGINSVAWDGRDDLGRRVSSGVYLYRVWKGPYTATGRMMLIK